MAYPAVRSVASSATDTDAASIVVTKPAGLAAGDLMIAFIGFLNAGGDRFNTTPSGWTVVHPAIIDTDNRGLVCYKKVADAGDAAASNFTFAFTGGNVDKMTGAIYAITGAAAANEITISEFDVSTPSGTTVTYTTALTPAVSESLVVVGWYVSDTNIAATVTGSSPTLTPTTTLTEDVDVGVRDGASDGISLFCYSGDYAGSTQITSRSVTTSLSVNDGAASIILLVNAPPNATATNATFEISPTIFEPSISLSASGTNALLEVSPVINDGSASGKNDTAWTNPDKPTTTWDNTPKL